MKPGTLRGQLLKWLIIPLTIVWLAGAVLAFNLANHFSRLAYDRALIESTQALATRVKLLGDRVDVDLTQQAEQQLRYDNYDKVYYLIRTADGTVLAGDPYIPAPHLLRDAASAQSNTIVYDDVVHGNKVRTAALSMILSDGHGDHEVLVQLAETLVERNTLSREILAGMLMPQLILICLAGLLVWYGLTRALVPLALIRSAIINRSSHDLHPIVEEHAPREIQPLISSINDLMVRLSDALRAQRHFITNAAHHLRTPLAGLRAQVELAERETDMDGLRHAIQQLRIGTERAIHLANQLLSLARIEQFAIQPDQMQRFDLTSNVRAITEQCVPMALAKNIDLGLDVPDQPVPVYGNAVLVDELIRNLIDNAVKYTPAHGRITVRVLADASPGVIVEDNGMGIAPENRVLVFDRFYRVLGTGVDGSGLGLAIAREIIQYHGGTIALREGKAQQGTIVEVRFPAPSSG